MQPITFDYLKVHNRFISPFDQSSGFCCFPTSRHGQPPEHTSSGHCFSLLACFSLFDGSLRALEIYMDPHLALSPSMIATDNSQLINYYYPQLISFVASGDKGQIVVHQITAGGIHLRHSRLEDRETSFSIGPHLINLCSHYAAVNQAMHTGCSGVEECLTGIRTNDYVRTTNRGTRRLFVAGRR